VHQLAPADETYQQAFRTCDLFAGLVWRVSHHALRLILERLQVAQQPGNLPACDGYHRRVFELPCSRVIRGAILQRQPLALADVAPQWRVVQAAGLVRDPHVVRPRGRPPGRSTRADPRHDADNLARRVRCGVCQALGHNARTCTAGRAPATQP